MPALYAAVLRNRWYGKVLRYMVEGDAALKSHANRHAMATLLRFLVAEKMGALAVRVLCAGKMGRALHDVCAVGAVGGAGERARSRVLGGGGGLRVS